jgi:signal transduction histidine kinase
MVEVEKLQSTTVITPERKHRLRSIGGSLGVAAFFFVLWLLLFVQERDKIYATQDRLLSVYAVYTELMFADIDDMIYRAPRAELKYMWRGRQNDDPMLHSFTLLDENKSVVFSTDDANECRESMIKYIKEADELPVTLKGVHVTEPFNCENCEGWFISFVRVLRDDNNNTTGYALAVFRLSVVAERYARLMGEESGMVSGLLSAEGNYLVRVPSEDADLYCGRPASIVDGFMEKGENYGKKLSLPLLGDKESVVSFAPIETYGMAVGIAMPYAIVYKRVSLFSAGFFAAWLALSFVFWRISRHALLTEQMKRLIERETRLKLESRAEEALIKQLEAEQKKREHERILVQQSKMAAMGEMIGAIAHQWRQPLNSIGLYVQDISDAYKFGQLSEEYLKNSVAKTMWQLQFMSSTINDFRNFFRPDKERKIFDLSKIVQNSIGLISAQLKSHDIEFNFEIPDEPLWCDGYENELGQATLNLINNAKDAVVERRKRGKRKIIVRLAREAQTARIEVEDNGGGVPPELMDRIFEPFFTTKNDGRGTGIGLYMSKMIVEDSMRGTIGVYNVEKGALFFISLPVARVGEMD